MVCCCRVIQLKRAKIGAAQVEFKTVPIAFIELFWEQKNIMTERVNAWLLKKLMNVIIIIIIILLSNLM